MQAVAFVLQGLVEPFADAVGLRAVGLGPGMVDVLQRQVELVGVIIRLPAALICPVGEDALWRAIAVSEGPLSYN